MISFGKIERSIEWLPIEECDYIEYSPTKISCIKYNDSIVFDEPTNLGYTFYIMQYKKIPQRFRDRHELVVKDLAYFAAVLLDPFVYIQSIAANGYSGYIRKSYPQIRNEFESKLRELDALWNCNV